MDLTTIQTQEPIRPPRIVIYGDPGIGKSTFMAGAPSALVLDIEGGLDALEVARYKTQSVADIMDAISTLYTQEHQYATLGIDSADWMEQLIFNQVAAEAGKPSIADIGYGAGYKTAGVIIGQILNGLNALRETKNMAIIMTAHAQIKRFDDPVRESYDRYQLKMHEQIGEKIKEWADCILFATEETFISTKEKRFNKEINKAATSGEHIIFTENHPAYLAKNRYGLPERLPFPKTGSWDIFMNAFINATKPKGEEKNG